MRPPKQRILILGGGFGGVYAALRLEKLLAAKLAKREAEITLVMSGGNGAGQQTAPPALHPVEISALDKQST